MRGHVVVENTAAPYLHHDENIEHLCMISDESSVPSTSRTVEGALKAEMEYCCQRQSGCMLLATQEIKKEMSVNRFVDQQFIAEIHQHRMVLEVKPTAEDIETAFTRPGPFIGKPTRQLLDENLLAQFPQNIADVLFRVTFRNQGRSSVLEPIHANPTERTHEMGASLKSAEIRFHNCGWTCSASVKREAADFSL